MAIQATGTTPSTPDIERVELPKGIHCSTDEVREDRWVVQFHPCGSNFDQLITSGRQTYEKSKLTTPYTLNHCHPSQAAFLKSLSQQPGDSSARIEYVFQMMKALEKCVLSMGPAKRMPWISSEIDSDRKFLKMLQKIYLKAKL